MDRVRIEDRDGVAVVTLQDGKAVPDENAPPVDAELRIDDAVRAARDADVVIMAVAAVVGGYGGAGVARKIGRAAVRRIVIAIGFGMAVSLFIKK